MYVYMCIMLYVVHLNHIEINVTGLWSISIFIIRSVFFTMLCCSYMPLHFLNSISSSLFLYHYKMPQSHQPMIPGTLRLSIREWYQKANSRHCLYLLLLGQQILFTSSITDTLICLYVRVCHCLFWNYKCQKNN